MRTPLRPVAVIGRNPIPLNTTTSGPQVTGRDGGHSIRAGNRTLFSFGDTFCRTPAGVNCSVHNTMLWTSDNSLFDGISTSATVTQNYNNNVVTDWIKLTTREVTFQNQGGLPVWLWGEQGFTLADGRAFAAFSKLHGTTDTNLQTAGFGLAEVASATLVATRLEQTGSTIPVNPVTSQPDPDILLNDGSWVFSMVVARDAGANYVYAFQARNPVVSGIPDNQQTTSLYVARAPVAGDAFKQTGNWRVYGAGGAWVALGQPKQAILTTSWNDGLEPRGSIQWSAFHNAWLMTHIQRGFVHVGSTIGWNNSNNVVMRVAPSLLGPWNTVPSKVMYVTPEKQANQANAQPYVGKLHPELASASGRNQVLTYTASGVGIMYKELRFDGARGDFTGNTYSDIALLGGNRDTIPVAVSNGNGTFTRTQITPPFISAFAKEPGVRSVSGDFNGDNRGDIAVVGVPTFNSIPLAWPTTDQGNFVFKNEPLATFPELALASHKAKVVPGDFNGDGKDDIALVGGVNQSNGQDVAWTTIPIAFSNGDGTFAVTNLASNEIAFTASGASVKVIPGDFNGDGKDDLALTGVNGWQSVVFALSNGIGSFTTSIVSAPTFAAKAGTAGAKFVAGDFDNNGTGDIAVTGVSGWTDVPMLLAFPDGTVRQKVGKGGFFGDFTTRAALPGATPVAGDFDGNGFSDIALVGGNTTTIPVAVSGGRDANDDIVLSMVNQSAGTFTQEAQVANAKPLGAY